MDKAETVKHIKPTVKLSDINFTPVLIALIAILVTFGKVEQRPGPNGYVLYWWCLILCSFCSYSVPVEEEVLCEIRHPAHRSVRIRQNRTVRPDGARHSHRDIHINCRKCGWVQERQCERPFGRYSRSWAFAIAFFRSIQNHVEGHCLCCWQCDRAEGYSRCGRVSFEQISVEFGEINSVYRLCFCSLQFFVHDFGGSGNIVGAGADFV